MSYWRHRHHFTHAAQGTGVSLRLGDTVGSYEVTGILGTGGSGQVFKVKHTVTGRVEALKRLRGAGLRDAQRNERLLREVRLQAKLSHPNIAAVHNAFWLDDDLVMVLELIQGRSLRRVLDLGRTPIPVALDYASQALSALDYTHKADAIHRDITPSNILITPEGVVKLTDFGLAKPRGDSAPPSVGTPAGSAYYMSPEQIRATTEIEPRSDLYSLGAVLYEMVTGRVPFRGEHLYGVMEAHIEREATPPSWLDSQVSPLLNDVILKALEKDPARRFQSASEFRSALAAVDPAAVSRSVKVPAPGPEEPGSLQPAVSSEMPEPRTEPHERWFRLPPLGSRAAKAWIAVSGSFLAALLVLLWQPSDPAPEVSEPKPAETAKAGTASVTRRDFRQEFVGPVMAEDVAEKRANGARSVKPVRVSRPRLTSAEPETEPKGPAKVIVWPPLNRATSNGGPRDRQRPGRREPQAKASPLGGEVAKASPPPTPSFESRRDEMQSADSPAGRNESEFAFRLVGHLDVGNTVWSLAFSRDGRRIAAGMENRGVGVWEAAGGERTASFDGHGDRVVAVAFSHDGKRLASGSSDGTAKIWDLDDRRESRTLGHKDGVTSLAFSPDGRRLASGSSDKALNIWDLSWSGAFREYRGHKRPAQAVAFSPNGKWLATGSMERVVRLWSLGGSGRRERIEGLQEGVSAVAFSPDGQFLAVAGSNRVKLMDVEKRRQLQVTYLPGWRYAIAFTSRGECLALSAQSATPDTIKLWEISRLEPLATLRHRGTVRSVAISHDGTRLAAGTDRGSISVWERMKSPAGEFTKPRP